MKKYECELCEIIYDPAKGDPNSGIPAGTPFEALPEDWFCPTCGVGKDHFHPVESVRKTCRQNCCAAFAGPEQASKKANFYQFG